MLFTFIKNGMCIVVVLHGLRLKLTGKQAIILLSLPCISAPLKVLTHNPSLSIPSVLAREPSGALQMLSAPACCAVSEPCGPSSPGCPGVRAEGDSKRTAPTSWNSPFVTSLWQSLSRWVKNWLCFQPENSPSKQLSAPVLYPAGLWQWHHAGRDTNNSPGSGCPAAWQWSVHCGPRSFARNL